MKNIKNEISNNCTNETSNYPCYIGTEGKEYLIEEECFSCGGESKLYKIKGEENLVAKVFREGKNTEERRRKLLAILSATEKTATKWVTWPVDILTLNGNFAGYVMPLVEGGKPFDVICSKDNNLTIKEKVQIAHELCCAVDSVHSLGQVIGDLNKDKILVNPETLELSLIDPDSYHFNDGNHTFRCVTVDNAICPSKLKDRLSAGDSLVTASLPTFTQETDEYALAVHVFALLASVKNQGSCEEN